MSLAVPIPDGNDPRWTTPGGLHVRASEGITRWDAGNEYTIKITAAQTAGALGFVVGLVPPGGGPAAHAHSNEDETFYLVSGELEFLNGNQIFTAGPGDLVFIPRGTRHRFKNNSPDPAQLIFMFTPGGQEGFFVEAGDEAHPGEQPEPWGPERYAQAAELIGKYGNVLLPEDE
jgi:quercetin dioxygenase-like cupin family protein